jgi:hypothetical protein
MERNKKRRDLVQAEKDVLQKKSMLENDENSALMMIQEYQKKVALIATKRKELEKEEKAVLCKKKAEERKITKQAISKATRFSNFNA